MMKRVNCGIMDMSYLLTMIVALVEGIYKMHQLKIFINSCIFLRWGSKNGWCRPSCIPISVILILIFLVVLLPVLDQATEKALQKLNNRHNANPSNICR